MAMSKQAQMYEKLEQQLKDELPGWEWEAHWRGGRRWFYFGSGPPSGDGIMFEVPMTYDVNTGMWLTEFMGVDAGAATPREALNRLISGLQAVFTTAFMNDPARSA